MATKFPSYVVRHPEKRVWLVHQFRQAYELDGTDLGQFDDSPEERALRRKVQELDRVALGEATRLFATSRNVAARLERSTGLARRCCRIRRRSSTTAATAYEGFVLSVSRLDRAKRIDLLLEAAALDSDARGRDRRRRPGPRASRATRARPRPRRTGAVRRPGLAERARRSLRALPRRLLRARRRGLRDGAVRGLPLGEAGDHRHRRRRPARGRLGRETGLVVTPDAEEIARALGWLREHRDEAASYGRAGKAIAREVTWDRAIGRLLS